MSIDDGNMSLDERAAELAKIGLTEDELTEGARFEIAPDDTDPLWEWVRIRQPRTHSLVIAQGQSAQFRAMKYVLASAAGICAMLSGVLPISVVQQLGLPVVTQILMSVNEVVKTMHDRAERGPSTSDPEA